MSENIYILHTKEDADMQIIKKLILESGKDVEEFRRLFRERFKFPPTLRSKAEIEELAVGLRSGWILVN